MAIKLPQRFLGVPLPAPIEVFHYSIETVKFTGTAILSAVEAVM